MRSDPHWGRIGKRAHHGICVPLFSLHTQGRGATFLDLIPLIDWCVDSKFDCLQLLPLYDTGNDLSPYNPISGFALHPRYLSTQSTPMEGYADFANGNPWLKPYAEFKALKEQFHHQNWRHWPEGAVADPKRVAFHMQTQYCCFFQMQQVKAHAEKRGLFLKGDIPFLISPDSADVWHTPSLFDLTLSAGAPPDAYNPEGQKWGFPPLRWEAGGLTWWQERLRIASAFFHIYRLDHVLGFFRLWTIPQGLLPKDGAFLPKERDAWPKQGEEILSAFLDSCPMLPMGEDLGTVPTFVPTVLKTLGICGTKVLRWQHHTLIHEYEPYSLTTVSTPDMAPLSLWWKNHPDEAISFAHFLHIPYQPILSRENRLAILRFAHATSSYFHINLLQEYLPLIPRFADEEVQINIPGTVLASNWTYRFRYSIEEIVAEKILAEVLYQTR